MEVTQVKKAVDALMKHSRSQEMTSLTDTDHKVLIQLVFKKVPTRPKHPLRLTLTHPILSTVPSICLITKDPQRYYKDLLKTKDIPIGRVIGVGKLKKKFKEMEAKRILCDSYDVFLVDERVLPIIPRWLGKYFYRKGKAPVKVKLTVPDLKSEVETAARSFMLSNLGTGNTVSIPCGRVSFDNEMIVENVSAAVKEIKTQVKPGMKNIKSIYIKTELSVALPVYVSLSNTSLKIKSTLKISGT